LKIDFYESIKMINLPATDQPVCQVADSFLKAVFCMISCRLVPGQTAGWRQLSGLKV